MVADLTRYRACKVHSDAPGKPVRLRKTDAAMAPDAAGPSEHKAPSADEPVRLFAWVSA